MCFDGKERLCNIRGKMRKKVWIGVGDIVLLGLRDFQDEKADVIQKYKPDEARRLKAQGHIPDNIQIEDDGDVDGEDGADDNGLMGIPPQQDYRGFSDLETTSEEEDSDEDEEDEEEEDDYWSKHGMSNSKGYGNKTANKRADFSIDNI